MNPMDWSNVFENQESNIELVLEKDKDPVKVMEEVEIRLQFLEP